MGSSGERIEAVSAMKVDAAEGDDLGLGGHALRQSWSESPVSRHVPQPSGSR